MAQHGNQPRQGLQTAWQLFAYLAAGGVPYSIPTSLRLDGPVFMDVVVQVGIFRPEEVQYKRYNHRVDISGAPLLSLGMSALNRGRTSASRRRAIRQATPQWRTLGSLRIVVTNCSTWWQEMGGWSAVPHDAVTEMHVDPHAETAVMSSRSMEPLRLAGPAAAHAGILIAYFVYAGQLAAVPGLGSFVAAIRSAPQQKSSELPASRGLTTPTWKTPSDTPDETGDKHSESGPGRSSTWSS